MLVCFLGPVLYFGQQDLLFAFDERPAKDACQVRYLVTADTSLPKGDQTRGKRCLQVAGSVPGPAWGLSKVVPLLFSLFFDVGPLFNWLIHQAMTDSAVVSMPLLAIMIPVCRMLWRSVSIVVVICFSRLAETPRGLD